MNYFWLDYWLAALLLFSYLFGCFFVDYIRWKIPFSEFLSCVLGSVFVSVAWPLSLLITFFRVIKGSRL